MKLEKGDFLKNRRNKLFRVIEMALVQEKGEFYYFYIIDRLESHDRSRRIVSEKDIGKNYRVLSAEEKETLKLLYF